MSMFREDPARQTTRPELQGQAVPQRAEPLVSRVGARRPGCRYRCIALVLCIGLANEAAAATCRSAEAATMGSKVGYDRDAQAAESVAKQASTWADVLSECVGGVTGVVNITMFPSLEEAINKIKNRVCSAARKQVQQATAAVSDAVSDATDGAVSTHPTSGNSEVVINPSTSWWSKVWR